MFESTQNEDGDGGRLWLRWSHGSAPALSGGRGDGFGGMDLTWRRRRKERGNPRAGAGLLIGARRGSARV